MRNAKYEYIICLVSYCLVYVGSIITYINYEYTSYNHEHTSRVHQEVRESQCESFRRFGTSDLNGGSWIVDRCLDSGAPELDYECCIVIYASYFNTRDACIHCMTRSSSSVDSGP